MAFLTRFPEVCQHEIVRDPITSITIVAQIVKGNLLIHRQGDQMSREYIPRSSHRLVFLRLGNQVLLDNQTERARPEDIITVACHPVVSQEVLSFASVIGMSRWQYPIMSPEYPPRRSLVGRLGRYHAHSLDLLARRPARIPEPSRHREGRVKDRSVDPRRIEVPVLMGCLSRLHMTEKILLDSMEERLYLRRGGQDRVYQPLGGEPLTVRIKALQLPVG